jgi:ring-1,2-phenylacetyl-CoA epoxidase subunit PaaB
MLQLLMQKKEKKAFIKKCTCISTAPNASATITTNYYQTITMSNLSNNADTSTEWPLWEVFIRSKQGLDHKHAGSLHAVDAQMAIENARDVYTRRTEGISIWVVESTHIHASVPTESAELFDPANDKAYRHPTFYDLPDEVKHM